MGTDEKLYAAFDNFLDSETWYTSHAFDEDRFYSALAQVVRNPQFSADNMGEYFRRKNNVTHDHPLGDTIQRLVCKADAVWEYLRRTGPSDC